MSTGPTLDIRPADDAKKNQNRWEKAAGFTPPGPRIRAIGAVERDQISKGESCARGG